MSAHDIQRLLPHTGVALVIDDAEITSPTQATGWFLVRADDPRVMGHFGIMPGVLIGEFAHQTAAFLMMREDPNTLPVLKTTHIDVQEAVRPGDMLLCKVSVDHRHKREASFFAAIFKLNDKVEKQIGTVSFAGTLMPKKIFERMQQHVAVSIPRPSPAAEARPHT